MENEFQMNQLLIVILSILVTATGIFLFPDGPTAVLLGVLMTTPVFLFINKQSDEKDFLLKIFLIGLILRILAAVLINSFALQQFFGPDSTAYDWQGNILYNYWLGNLPENSPAVIGATNRAQAGWGMYYIVAIIYLLIGNNNLAVQFFCAVLGAATTLGIYFCAKNIFANTRVAKTAAVIVALSPSLILWSAQALKDGIVVFLLVVTINMVLRLQKQLSYPSFILLMVSLFGIFSLRFYISYLLVLAIVGSFVISKSTDSAAIIKRGVLLLFIGLAVMGFMSTRNIEKELDQFSLEKLNETREDLARGNAGFGRDLDVSTAEGALSALPIGFVYLMFAPFPWQMGNFRQVITFPEMVLWYSSIPFLISGLWYTLKHRLRPSIAVLLFTMMLTVSYSLYLGNVGTAYRQRAQVQIFHFMFIAVGFVLWQEKKENKRALQRANRTATLKNLRERKMTDYLNDENTEDAKSSEDTRPPDSK